MSKTGQSLSSKTWKTHIERVVSPGPGSAARSSSAVLVFQVTEPLYPLVASTARNTKMTLLTARRDLGSLMERSRASLVRGLPRELLPRLPLPPPLRRYLQDGFATPVSLPATNPAHRLLI